MPYIVTRVQQKPKEFNVFDFLDGNANLQSIFTTNTKFAATQTRTYYYDVIIPEKMKQINIPRYIDLLKQFYETYKHLDVNNNTTEYNYELQVELMKKYKAKAGDIDMVCKMTAEELARCGYKYNPNYFTFYRLKAKSTPEHKKWRRIDAPQEELCTCLQNLKTLFEAFMNGCYYHTAAFAYIKNRSAADAARKHANAKSNWFLNLDFSNFFGSTTIDFVMRMFSDIFPFSEIVKSKEGKEALRNCLGLCFLNGTLPQGTPMSPIITNIMMIPIDYKIANGLSRKKAVSPNGNRCSYTYTRYADDIAVTNRFSFDYKEIIRNIRAVLRQYDAPFDLNDEKTRYGSNAGANWMLGVMVNQEHEVTVGYKRKKQLKGALTNYMLDKKNGHPWSFEDVQHLQGEIAYCKMIEKENIDNIIEKYSEKYGDIMNSIREDIKKGA